LPIHYEKGDDHVVLVTIDRPEARNALDLYHFRDLAAAWRRFKDDDDAWVAIVTGVERNFMVGGSRSSRRRLRRARSRRSTAAASPTVPMRCSAT
jgi:enoyl-CoA hydratase